MYVGRKHAGVSLFLVRCCLYTDYVKAIATSTVSA